MELHEIVKYFSDVKNHGLDIDIHFRVKRKKNGKFDGVEYMQDYLLSNIEKINPYEFKNEIIKKKSLITKLSKNEIDINYKNQIDKEFNKKIGIYIFNSLGKSIIVNGYQSDVYDYPGYTSLQEKYPDENDIKMLRVNSDVDNFKRIYPFIDFKIPFQERDSRKGPFDNREIRFFDDSIKTSYVIHNIDYKFKLMLNQSKGDKNWESKYTIDEDFYKLKRSILLEVKKINLNIYDHFGNLHKYTEYHKLGTINFDK